MDISIPLFIFSTCLLLTYSFTAHHFSRCRLWYFHPLSLLLILTIVDVVIPSMIFAVFGRFQNMAVFEAPLTAETVLYGLMVHLLFYTCLLLGFIGTIKPQRSGHPYAVKYDCSVYGVRGGFYYALIIIFAFVAYSTLSAIVEEGGVLNYVKYNMINRFNPNPIELHLIDQIIQSLNLPIILKLLIITGFYFRRSLRPSFIFSWVLPFLWLCYSALQGSRGTIILAILPFIAIELVRRNQQKKANERFGMFAILFAIVLFAGYGSIRSNIEQGEHQEPISEAVNNAAVDILGTGYGIRGLSAIVGEYGNNRQYFYGKTYLDMLLLPIPRSIYTNKPEWYGIDDITRAMGWPESTESAVTMPGEAYANFGIAGVFMGVVFGMLFRLFKMNLKVGASPLLFLYIGVGMPALLVANWMSFTGIMNSFVRLLVGYLFLNVILKPAQKAPVATELQLHKGKRHD